MGLTYSVLGPLEVRDEGRLVPLTRAKDRRLLAALLVHPNQVVSTDRLLDVLWGDHPPPSGLKALQFHVSALRNVLSPDRTGPTTTCVQTRPPGYVLEVTDHDVDVGHFRRLVDNARGVLSYDPVEAHRWLSGAMALWRGPAYGEFAYAPFAEAEIHRLEEERLAAIEMLHAAELALGRHADAIPRLAALTSEFPYRERFHALLITALYRSGRQAEALEAYQHLRRRLRDELGIGPSPELVALENDVLLQSDSLTGEQHSSRTVVGVGIGPAQLTPFIGRTRELAQTAGLIERNRLVTVVGTGGSGKTRLAIDVASRLPTTLVDSVVFVDLSVVTDDSLVDLAVLAAAGGSEAANRSTRESLVDLLADRCPLIMLDNCEHLARAAASIAGYLLSNTTGVRVLATSQQVLKTPGETVYAIPPMATSSTSGEPADRLTSDAATLFLDHARRARPGFVASPSEATQISAIVRDLDGIPLAIELAAARTRTMTVADVAATLALRLRLLTDGSPIIRRQQTLEAAVAWSYELTHGRERDLFDRLSVFAGSFTHRAAAEVGEIDDQIDVTELLGRLVDKSLVTVDASGDEIRYRLLETLRLFGSARLRERGEIQAVAKRHATHFLTLTLDANELLQGIDQGTWHDRFRRSAPDVRQALEALLVDRPDDALAVVSALGRYWYREGSLTEGTAWMQRALAAADPTPGPARVRALTWLAGYQHFAGRYDDSLEVCIRAVDMARDLGDPIALCSALNLLGVSSQGRGLPSEAIAHFEDALDAEALSGAPPSASVLWNIGVAYIDLADMEGIEQVAERLRAAEGPESAAVVTLGTACADLLQCNVAIVRGRLVDARALGERALDTAMHLASSVDAAEMNERLAEISYLEGDFEAVDRHLELVAEFRRDVEQDHQWRANLVRARRALALGDLSDATRCLTRVVAVARDHDQPFLLSSLLHESSRLAFLAGGLEEAAMLHGATMRIAHQPRVTLAEYVLDQALELRESLVVALGAADAERLIERGATHDIGESLEISRRCLHL